MQKYGFTLLYNETVTYQTIAIELDMANLPVHNTRLIYMANFVDNSTYEQDSFLCDAIEMKCLCDTVRSTNS